ncbi:hypothetical protein PMAYCL1PPCAC_22756, partial [Pristionchus mayeri]
LSFSPSAVGCWISLGADPSPKEPLNLTALHESRLSDEEKKTYYCMKGCKNGGGSFEKCYDLCQGDRRYTNSL